MLEIIGRKALEVDYFKYNSHILMSQGDKNVPSDRGSNPGRLAYRESALPTELSDCLTHYLHNGD